MEHKQIPGATSTHLILNFNVNTNESVYANERNETWRLIALTKHIINCWYTTRYCSPRRAQGSVTIRFWICDIEVYDDLIAVINGIWYLDGPHRDYYHHLGANIELMFYELEDEVPLPDAASIALLGTPVLSRRLSIVFFG
jgi:hypothetical protein